MRPILEEGSVIEGEICDFTHDGKGVLKHDGAVIFTEGLIGDLVRTKILRKKKNLYLGRTLEWHRRSPDFIESDCPISSACGGCQFRHLKYPAQLEWKMRKVRADLQKFAKVTVKADVILGMEDPYRYRNHIQIPFSFDRGKVKAGFFAQGTKEIVDCETCLLQPEAADILLREVRNWSRAENFPLKHLGIRLNHHEQVMLILVTETERRPNLKRLLDALEDRIEIISVFQNINPSDRETYGDKFVKLYGEDYITERLCDRLFLVSPGSFFQTNREQAEVLFQEALSLLEPKKDWTLVDLFCGTGTFGILASDKVKRVIGVEAFAPAVKDAIANAELNGIRNMEFFTGRAEAMLELVLNEAVNPDAIVLDPPRAGCDRKMMEMIAEATDRVLYISCNSTTMATDISVLIDRGFELKDLSVVDMFPWTSHVETVALLSKLDVDQ